MAYVPLSSIHIDTKTKKSGKLARVIEFDLPQQTLDQNAGKIRSYFAGNDITWENTSDGKTLCISFDANNFSDLAQKKQELSFIQRILLELTAPHAARTTLLH